MMITHPSDIEKNTVRISCGNELGSGFFISNCYVITARHVILDNIDENAQITATATLDDGKNIEYILDLKCEDLEKDIAVLSATNKHNSCLPAIMAFARVNTKWNIYGYPFENSLTGRSFSGKIESCQPNQVYDLILQVDNPIIDYDYSGLSGSALVANNIVIGVVISQHGAILNGISLLALEPFFKQHNIVDVEQDSSLDELPGCLGAMRDDSICNSNTVSAIDEKIQETEGRILVLHGPPGSGKTVLAATYKPSGTVKCEVIGKYFVKIPNDTMPPFRRASKDFFIDWLENIIHTSLKGIPPSVQNLSIEKRIVQLFSWLTELNDIYLSKGELGILIIDGIDDLKIYNRSIEDFLDIFSGKIPSNIRLILSCTSKDILPPYIKSRIDKKYEIKMAPLEISDCTAFIHQKLKHINISLIQAHAISEKSEGHPLYMHYLIEYVKNREFHDDLDSWILQIPIISGNIQEYYNFIWDSTVSKDSDKVWLLATISYLRQPIPTKALFTMLPENIQMVYSTIMPSISHLLKLNYGIEIYHNSFTAFVNEKTVECRNNIHDCIVTYCTNYPEDIYSVANNIYHLLNASQPSKAIHACTQKWTDNCALRFISPDLIIYDICDVEAFAIDQGDILGFIRIKLLLQRIRFRYNNDLAQNAFLLADTFITLGQFDNAIFHLIRQGNLIASDDEAFYLLQRLHENKATATSIKALNEAIEKRFLRQVEEEMSNHYIDYSTLRLKAVWISLSSNNNLESSHVQFLNYLGSLRKLLSESPKNNNKHDLELLMTYFIGNYHGYLLWCYDIYTSMEQMTREGKYQKSNKTIINMCAIAQSYLHFQIRSDYDDESDQYEQLILDIESLVDEFGFPDEPCHSQSLLNILFDVSTRSDIIESLILVCDTENKDYSIRNNNGVDLDHNNVLSMMNDYLHNGYIARKNLLHDTIEIENDWEAFFSTTLKQISYIKGKCCRLQLENKPPKKEDLEYIDNILTKIDFTLVMRVKWDRSYALPEDILPYIYEELASFFIVYCDDKIDDFVECVIARIKKQFGVYTEGVRTILFRLAGIFCRKSEHFQNASKIIRALEEHVEQAVQNRIERTPELLQLCNLYAKVGNQEQALNIYGKMLNTSMGPGWYKEDQFSIINTALQLSLPTNQAYDLFKVYAGCLEHASGEMTFQRYVRYAKEHLIGNLAQKEKITQAIEYLKYQVLPTPSKVAFKVKSSNIDSLSPGYGYVNGANDINIQAGIIQLLQNSNGVSASIQWALAEIFIINDDISRYKHDFFDIMLIVISSSSDQDFLSQHQLIERLVNLILHDQFDNHRANSINYIDKKLPKDLSKLLNACLDKKGYIPPPINSPVKVSVPKKSISDKVEDNKHEDNKDVLSGFPGMGTLGSLKEISEHYQSATEEFGVGNQTLAKKHILEGLTYMHNHSVNLWLTNLSTQSTGLVELLAKINTQPHEFIQTLKPFIIKSFTDDWYVVDRLLCLLRDYIPPETASKINDIVLDHINNIVQPPRDFSKDFERLMEEESKESSKELCCLMIWLLNYPIMDVKIRTYQIISWLLEVNPMIIIPDLIMEALSDKPKDSCELSALLLKLCSKNLATMLWSHIKDDQLIYNKIIDLKHFSIKNSFVQIFNECNPPDDSDFSKFKFKLQNSIPECVYQGAACTIDDKRLFPLSRELFELNNMRIFDKGFFFNVYEELNRLISSDIASCLKYDSYIKRSFAINEPMSDRTYKAILRYAINCSLSRLVEQDMVNPVAAIISLGVPQ